MASTVENIRIRNWGFWVAAGIILMIIGIILLASPIFTSIASVLVFGTLLVVAGLVHIVTAFLDKSSDHLWLHLVMAAITIVVGILMLLMPVIALASLTLLIAVFFLSSGLFRIIGVITKRFTGWGWYLFNGFLNLLLGILILIHWPASSLWVIGLFIGIDFIFAGLSILMIALAVKKHPLVA